jgi:hypothetical protein
MTKTGVLSYALRAAGCAAFVFCTGSAWADDVTIVTEPANPAPDVTIVAEPAETKQVTVIDDSRSDVRIEHEAIVGFQDDDEPVSAIIVKTAPPEPRQEVVRIEARPAEDAVWVPGYWRWDADRNTYEWVAGAWRRAIPGMTWHAGRWIETEGGYQWMPGHWEAGEAAATVTTTPGTATTTTTTRTTTVEADGDTTTRTTTIKQAPPALRVETQPASPGPDYVWIAGHWEYRDGQYTWIGGRWERPVSEGMIWVSPRWVRHGDGTYSFVAGHWDYPLETRSYVVSRTIRGADLDDDAAADDSARDSDLTRPRTDPRDIEEGDQVRERD